MITLYVDRVRWERSLHHVTSEYPGLVPVAKGNGYGFGIAMLAAKANELGADTLAVGTYREVGLAAAFDGSVMVLTPWRPFETHPTDNARIVHTVGRVADLRDLARRTERPRVVLERMTSMRRHGLSGRSLREAGDVLGAVDGCEVALEGVTFHLPFSRGSNLVEAERLMCDVAAAALPTRTVYLSHLTHREIALLRANWPDYTIRPRIGTSMWLGDPGARSVKATVLDVHEVLPGDVIGYRGRSVTRRGFVVVVSGGTAHGIGLEAPGANTSLRKRAATLARGFLDAAGLVRSPFTINGRRRMFAEPPHMQMSLVFVRARADVPEIGDEVDVRVRYTTTSFDRTVIR